MTASTLIQIDNVSFGYGHEPVVEAISMDVRQGEFLGLIGPNGGGKTTLLKLMLGLLRPDHGNIFLFGQSIREFRQWPRIGYVSQRATQTEVGFPITVEEVVALGRVARIGLLRRFGPGDRQAVQQALEQVGLADLRKRRITELSGGQQQRVFIARALASAPEILLLDEPTVGVDVEAQEQFYQLLASLNTGLGLTLVMVSHDLDTVASAVTRVACLNRHLVYHGDPQALDSGGLLDQLYGQSRRLVLHRH